jgi:hypothetical protein
MLGSKTNECLEMEDWHYVRTSVADPWLAA